MRISIFLASSPLHDPAASTTDSAGICLPEAVITALIASSPFYIQPRLDLSLMDWGLKFIRSANNKHIERSAIPLRDIAILSKNLYEQWAIDPAFDFGYKNAGLLEMFQTPANAEHAHHSVEAARELGLEAYLLNKEQTQALEPSTPLNVAGAVFFKSDAHLDPGKLMLNLLVNCRAKDF